MSTPIEAAADEYAKRATEWSRRMARIVTGKGLLVDPPDSLDDSRAVVAAYLKARRNQLTSEVVWFRPDEECMSWMLAELEKQA